MLLPRLVASSLQSYAHAFALFAALADLFVLLGLWRLVDRLVGVRDARARATASLTWLAVSASLGLLSLQRLDVFVAATLVWGLAFALGGRRLLLGDVLLAVGALLKLVPALALPAVFLLAWRTRGPRAAALHAARFSGALVVLTLPVVALAGGSLSSFLSYHTERGLQIESLFGSALVLVNALAPFGLESVQEHGATHLAHDVAGALASLSTWLAALGVIAVVIVQARRLVGPDTLDERAARRVAVETAALVLVVAMLLGKVLSPQYLLWLLPLLAALVPVRADGERLFWLALAAAALTWLGYPVLHLPLAALDGAAALVVVLRNLILALIALALLSSRRAEHGPPPRREPHGLLAFAPWLVLAAWLLVSSLHPVLDVDLWFHLRVGRDLLLSGEVPRVDAYSATVAGRPFVAHSWLAEALLSRLYDATLGDALPFLRAYLLGMTAVTLLLALANKHRRGLFPFLFSTLGLYLLSAHAAVRPYLFSVFFAALVALALEVWRRRRTWSSLAWLVPVVGLWANVHGAFLLAPALLFATAGGVLLEARFGNAGAFTTKDALKPALVGVGGLLVALVNPYGIDLYAHALGMFFDSGYIGARITEWMSSLSRVQANGPWYWLQLVFVAALLGALLLNARRRPVVDVVLVAVLVVLWMKAVRFLPYLVVVGLPLAIRLGAQALPGLLSPAAQRERPLVQTALAGALLFVAVFLGVGYVIGGRVPLGLGVERPLASVPLHHLRESGARGAVFNDYEDGSYLVYAGPPDLFPVIDGRIDVYGRELVEEYEAARAGGPPLLAYLERHRVQAALLTRPGSARVVDTLDRTPGWRRVAHQPGRWVVFVRQR